MTRPTTRPHPFDRNRLLLRAAGALVVTLMSTGAGCPGGEGGSTGSTGDFGTDGSSGDPSVTDSMTMTTTEPATMSTTEPTTMSTTMTTADPTTDSDPTDTDPTDTDPTDTDPTDTSNPTCIADGTYIGVRVSREDLYGHFPYLMLFYDPDAADELTDEYFDITVAPDGTITVTLVPRESGSGSGHAGLAGLTGTVDADCAVAIDTTAAFESDTGPFGDISVAMTGTLDAMSLTLQGGGIPSGPITYELTLAPE